MAGEWQRYEVSKLIDAGALVIGDGYRAKNQELGDSGLPFARAGNINDGFRFDDADHFPEINIERVGNKVSQPGDVVFTSKGTVGRFALVGSSTPRFVYSPQLCFWRSLDRDVIDPRFLFYWMYGREFFVQFSGVAGQTDMAEYVSLTDQRRMHITLPAPPEQRAIAHILGTLDDKIELNRCMNETLEAIARALFKSWFVDFDPVRAKAEDRDPGLPKSLAELFPARFEDSELGTIPAGWQEAALGDLCQRIAMGPFGSDIKTDNFVESGVPVVRGGNLTHGFVDEGFVFVSEDKANDLRNANAFPGDIVITHRGTLGQVGLIPKPSRFRRYVVSQSQMLLSVNPDLATPHYIFEYLRSPMGQHALLANTSSTGVPAIARPTSSLRAIRLLQPPVPVLASFERTLGPLIERRNGTAHETRSLAALRDALLAKLISGDLRVTDANRIVTAHSYIGKDSGTNGLSPCPVTCLET
jgi:type I restriction enzyme S subunit